MLVVLVILKLPTMSLILGSMPLITSSRKNRRSKIRRPNNLFNFGIISKLAMQILIKKYYFSKNRYKQDLKAPDIPKV